MTHYFKIFALYLLYSNCLVIVYYKLICINEGTNQQNKNIVHRMYKMPSFSDNILTKVNTVAIHTSLSRRLSLLPVKYSIIILECPNITHVMVIARIPWRQLTSLVLFVVSKSKFRFIGTEKHSMKF